MSRPLRQWKLTGESLARIRPTEATVRRLKDRLDKLAEELHNAEERMFFAVHQEIGLKEFVNFTLNAEDQSRFVIDELPTNLCPGCGEEHEGEEHQSTQIH
jgi:DNA repair exonuclease SbcCD ATPase subunit